jgi:hypothetical protein
VPEDSPCGRRAVLDVGVPHLDVLTHRETLVLVGVQPWVCLIAACVRLEPAS